MGESGKRPRSYRDDADGKNQRRRTDRERDKDERGNDELVVYRILCPDTVIGSVIGKNGKVINSIRQDSRAKVKVVDPFPAIANAVAILEESDRRKRNKDREECHRSRAKTKPDQWTVVPLPAKILALLADALLEIQEEVDADNEDSDWEETQNGKDGDDEDMYSANATSHSRPTYEYLDDEEDDHEDDELLCSADPLNEINLLNYVVESLRKFSESDGASKPQQHAIELVLRQQGI